MRSADQPAGRSRPGQQIESPRAARHGSVCPEPTTPALRDRLVKRAPQANAVRSIPFVLRVVPDVASWSPGSARICPAWGPAGRMAARSLMASRRDVERRRSATRTNDERRCGLICCTGASNGLKLWLGHHRSGSVGLSPPDLNHDGAVPLAVGEVSCGMELRAKPCSPFSSDGRPADRRSHRPA